MKHNESHVHTYKQSGVENITERKLITNVMMKFFPFIVSLLKWENIVEVSEVSLRVEHFSTKALKNLLLFFVYPFHPDAFFLS